MLLMIGLPRREGCAVFYSRELSVAQDYDAFFNIKSLISDVDWSLSLFSNDISGVRKAPDKRFSKALTSSSDQYEDLYPSLAGPTMILNLPLILQAFVRRGCCLREHP